LIIPPLKSLSKKILARFVQAPEADVLNLASVPEEQEGEGEGDVEELEETIEALKQQKRMLAERNAGLQNKVHQARLHPFLLDIS